MYIYYKTMEMKRQLGAPKNEKYGNRATAAASAAGRQQGCHSGFNASPGNIAIARLLRKPTRERWRSVSASFMRHVSDIMRALLPAPCAYGCLVWLKLVADNVC
jgi:hypothetical protein